MIATRLRWRDWPLGLKGAAVIALPVTLLLASLYSNYALQRDVSRADQDVQRTLTIRADIQALHTLVAEAATGVRGYLLTGREEFLSPYWMAQQRIPGTLATLRTLVRDPQQVSRLAEASRLVASKLASLEDLRRNGAQLEPDALQAHLQDSKAVLDELRLQIALLGEREALLLAERTATATVARRRELLANVVMACIGLVSAGFALWILSSGIIRRVQLAAINAERLAKGQSLTPPPAARDELGLLAERLHRASLLLAERAAQADAANLAKTEFLSRTSHELRTPLNVILGFAQLLEADLGRAPTAPHVAQILGAGRHLLNLIDEMLDIARIEAGDLKLQPETVWLAPLLQEAAALAAPLAARHAVQLPEVEAGEIAVEADRQRLRQVLLNLVTNAVKFNRPGGSVRIRARAAGPRVRIAVTDTGPGIAPAQLSRLFAPFERLDAERHGIEGTGLGLAISRQLMHYMGGSIEVDSTPGAGSTFTLELPAASAASRPAATAASTLDPPTHAATGLAPRHALYIEDNQPNIALMRALFARRPLWRLSVARSGAEGLRLAREDRPDLVMLDLHLPDQSGESVIDGLRADERLRDTPYAILSADALPATIERLRAGGAVDYLTKPLELPRVLALLDRHAT